MQSTVLMKKINTVENREMNCSIECRVFVHMHTLTVVSSSIADSDSCQVVKEVLELKSRQVRFKSHLIFMKPAKTEDKKTHFVCVMHSGPNTK